MNYCPGQPAGQTTGRLDGEREYLCDLFIKLTKLTEVQTLRAGASGGVKYIYLPGLSFLLVIYEGNCTVFPSSQTTLDVAGCNLI